MNQANFASRAVRNLRRAAGVPDPSTPELVHPWLHYNPDAKPVVDKVTPAREVTPDEFAARAAHLNDAQMAGLRATAAIKSPPPVPGTKFGAVNGVTGWAGAQ